MRRRRRVEVPVLSLTPLIDTALTLLIIFMVSAPAAYRSVSLQLPNGQGHAEAAERPLVVSVTSDGLLYLDGERFAQDALLSAVRARSGEKGIVCVRGDARAKYGMVISLVDHIKQTGVSRVAMVVHNEHKKS